jgi:hypothetical protein
MIPIRQSNKVRGRAVRREPGRMNGWEKRYSLLLEQQMRAGEIQYFRFDSLKLRLAPKTFYDTDFLVVTRSGEVEVHEVKGHWEDDARVKVKVAAEMFPFRFKAITLDPKTGWKEEEF